MSDRAFRILVTGEPADEKGRLPREAAGRRLEWTGLPVLDFERIAVDAALLRRVAETPFGWIVLASPRAVRFWSATLLEHGVDFPLETQVACIGERTAEVAADDGYTPDFYPLEAGTEGFLAEFEELLAQRSEKPSVLVPAAEGGRTTVRERLTELGCAVTWTPLYRTKPRGDLAARMSPAELSAYDAIVFTSPSSVDAFLGGLAIPERARVLSLGTFTGEHLARRGVGGARLVPQSDYARIGEVLC